ncbi:MAG: hypothetical protein GX625_01155 [Clostridiaceae bacterium]|nr:hypothetical protein [Clostridiaceae bacterium]
MDFNNRVKEHMAKYKVSKLGIEKDGLYNNKPYKHILPEKMSSYNIIENYREDFYSSLYKENIKYHKCFHHLNSSQAMCINFFYPLIKEDKIKILLDVIGVNDGQNNEVGEVCFEKGSHLKERTSFDFYIKLLSGIEVFFEIKYTEEGFGKTDIDDKHKRKYEEKYKKVLEANDEINQENINEQYFLNNYQLMRNIIHISDRRYIVFLYPKENHKIENELKASKDIIKESYHSHLIILTWEKLLKERLRSSIQKSRQIIILMNFHINICLNQRLTWLKSITFS